MKNELLFLKSMLTTENPFNSIQDLVSWIGKRNEAVRVNIRQMPFGELTNWSFDGNTKNLRHVSGKFFSIDGLRIKNDSDLETRWTQPIINQPEIGYLGILTKEFDGVLYFLMQAKIEPGNVNCVQISPTLQATKSNYTQTHAGQKPAYLEYFVNASKDEILVDQLQSEQGARFLKKRNRNVIIKTESEIELDEDFRWLTLGQIKRLILLDNIVNMDTRTVISSITFSNQALLRGQNTSGFSNLGHDLFLSAMIFSGMNTIGDILSWLCTLKTKSDKIVEHIPLAAVDDWLVTENEIVHKEGRYFKIIGVNVQIENREVKDWCQPIIEPSEHGICAFLVKKIYGTYHFLVQAKYECGNFDMYEFAPTIQCLQSELKKKRSDHYFLDYIRNINTENVLLDVMQSEEGGRFYKEQNRNLIIRVDDIFHEKLPENYAWMTLGQLNNFLKYNNLVNIQARSLLAGLQYV